MMKPRALMATAFALGLAFAGCGSITTQDGGTPGTAGAGAGTAAVVAGGRNAATFPSGTPVTVRLIKPATVTVEE